MIHEGDRVRVLEEKVDVNTQIQFFKEVNSKPPKYKLDDSRLQQFKSILSRNVANKNLKIKALVELAISINVDTYRFIEQYAASEKSLEIRDWALLAKNFAQMSIENKLSKKTTVFVSSGLGGKEDKLRYMVVFVTQSGYEFVDVQKSIIESEFRYELSKHGAEFESVRYYDKYAIVKCLTSVEPDVKDLIHNVYLKANELGGFISENYIVTNVKDLSIEEIEQFLKKSELHKESMLKE